MAVANQYHVYIKKPATYSETFFTASVQNVNQAGKVLSPNSFRVYLWFLQNQSGYHFDLYAKKVMADLEISQSSYDRAIRELKKEGYLVYKEKKNCNYIYEFYDSPQTSIQN